MTSRIDANPDDRAAGRHRQLVGCAAVLAGALLVHGWSLGGGLLLDDHWHRRQLLRSEWSLAALLNDATIEPARFIHFWWQDRPVRWEYARPASIALLKLVYQASDGDPTAAHAVSLALHALNALLVYALCWLLTRSAFWSAVGGLLFAAYSHSVIAVAWLAAQNAILQTTLTLAAMLLYIRASRLRVGPLASLARGAQPGGTAPLRPASLAATLWLWVLALLSRENALAFPLLMLALDGAFGGGRHLLRRLPAYAPFVMIALAFAYWRATDFDPMPDVYVRRYDGPGYLPWLAVKLLHYVCSAVWLSPMTIGPSGRLDPLREVPGDCALMLAIVGVMGLGYWLACRRIRGWWVWPLWILLALLPVAPVMATPHSGYMPGVGFAVAMVLGPALRRGARPVSIGLWSPGVALWFLVATHVYVPIYRSLYRAFLAAERLTVEQLVAWERAERAASTNAADGEVFFLNMPFINVYAGLCLAEEAASGDDRPASRSGAPAPRSDDPPPARFHVLTCAPDALRMDQPCRIEQLDERRFTIETTGRGYFSGFLGRFLLAGMRRGGRLHAGQRLTGPRFDVEVLEADADGVRKLLFDFRRPLASPDHRFYVATSECPAARVVFSPAPPAPGPPAILTAPALPGTPPAAQARLAELVDQRDSLHRTRARTARIIRTDLYLTGPPFPGPR